MRKTWVAGFALACLGMPAQATTMLFSLSMRVQSTVTPVTDLVYRDDDRLVRPFIDMEADRGLLDGPGNVRFSGGYQTERVMKLSDREIVTVILGTAESSVFGTVLTPAEAKLTRYNSGLITLSYDYNYFVRLSNGQMRTLDYTTTLNLTNVPLNAGGRAGSLKREGLYGITIGEIYHLYGIQEEVVGYNLGAPTAYLKYGLNSLSGRSDAGRDSVRLGEFELSLFGDPAPLPGGTGGVVPEPATWATMLLGFGLLGTAARRRRALASG